MTIALVQQPDAASGSGTAASNTFAVTPTTGNLIVFNVMVANNATITADDGSLTEIGTGYETFRRLSTFAKIAGGAEPKVFSFTISTSSSYWVFATEYSTTDTWSVVSGAQFALTFDSSGANPSVTTNLAATTAGSLLVASGYMGNSDTGNQEITTGFSNFEQPDATGTTRRCAQADKLGGAGGSQDATYGRVDVATDNRLASVLTEFQVSVVTDSVTPDDPILDAETSNAYSPSGFASGNITGITLDGVSLATFDQTTFDNIDIVAVANDSGVSVPAFGTVVFEATNGTETANANTTNNVKAGWTNQVLAAIETVDANYLYQLILTQLGWTIANGDTMYYPIGGGDTIAADGGFNFLTNPISFVWITAAGVARPLTWQNGALSPVIRTKYRRFPWQSYNKLL